jgi:osmoprotectant transport system permease protein
LSYLNYFISNWSMILTYAGTHFSLVLETVVISPILWLPVGVLISRNDKVARSESNFICS